MAFTVIGGSVSLRNRRDTPLIIQSFGNDVVAVGSRIIDFPLSFVSGSLNNVHDLLNTQDENNYLKSKVTDLEQTKARNASLEAENKQLKSALKVKIRLLTIILFKHLSFLVHRTVGQTCWLLIKDLHLACVKIWR